jgi:hypothetical protein
MKITIGTNVKRLRTEKGVTQEQLAEAMNVTCAAVKPHGTDDLLKYSADCCLHAPHPRGKELLENAEYRAVIGKYKR